MHASFLFSATLFVRTVVVPHFSRPYAAVVVSKGERKEIEGKEEEEEEEEEEEHKIPRFVIFTSIARSCDKQKRDVVICVRYTSMLFHYK